MKSKINIYTIVLYIVSLLIFVACSDYLDVIPDKVQDIDKLFERKETAYKALATCYHFLPEADGVWSNYSWASDELIATNLQGTIPGREMMRGKQNTGNPYLGFWHDYSYVRTQESLFKAIRCCNIFIENIDRVFDMTDNERNSWKAEAIFLKAYYHFLLFAQYGPIPIVDNNLEVDASPQEMRVYRQAVDDVVAYIVNTIDLAMKNLPVRVTLSNDLGRVDQVIAAAIKSRVLLYAASPLFNGNAEFYQNFKDDLGKHLFDVGEPKKEKWQVAAEAAEEALKLALENGVSLYTYDTIRNPVNDYDKGYMHHEEIQALYNYRHMFVEKWNTELIWGNSSPVLRDASYWSIQASSMPMNNLSSANEASWSWSVPTLEAVESYYTENGLPIDEDNTYLYDRRYRLARVAAKDSLHAVFGQTTINLHLGREPRFYATIGFDRGKYRIWGEKWDLYMRFGEKNGRKTISTKDYSVSGYYLKKVCHPNSEGSAYNKLIIYPWPIIRLGELYLNYAEALNEAEGPSQKVYDALNEVRRRSGIPDVENSWSNAIWAKTVNKHESQKGLREIIRQERRIELAFEGWRNFDVRRWKEGNKYFNVPARGWVVEGESTDIYYNNTQPINIMERSFITPRDYLHPIPYNELNRNPNLVQNPGW